MDVECVMSMVDDQVHAAVSEALEKPHEEDIMNDFKIKDVDGLLKDIAQLPFKQHLVERLAISYRFPDPKRWLSQLDGNDHLLGFKDCVYDFEERCFRDGRPEDVVSMSTCHKRADIEAHMGGSEIGEEIINAIGNMHESEDVLRHVLQNLATYVAGNRPNDRFQIRLGTCANGKGLTKKMAASAFSSYYYEPTACLSASLSVSGSVLSSELAKLNGKRVCIASETGPRP